MFLIEACCFAFCKLNSSPIDELGEGAHESKWWCYAKCKPQAGCADIDRNPESRNHHQATSHRETQWRITCKPLYSQMLTKREGPPATQKQDILFYNLTYNLIASIAYCLHSLFYLNLIVKFEKKTLTLSF